MPGVQHAACLLLSKSRREVRRRIIPRQALRVDRNFAESGKELENQVGEGRSSIGNCYPCALRTTVVDRCGDGPSPTFLRTRRI
jgi:hypothetical protein